jgi:hypothetical protein
MLLVDEFRSCVLLTNISILGNIFARQLVSSPHQVLKFFFRPYMLYFFSDTPLTGMGKYTRGLPVSYPKKYTVPGDYAEILSGIHQGHQGFIMDIQGNTVTVSEFKKIPYHPMMTSVKVNIPFHLCACTY